MYPQELKYAKTHEWARLDGDTATIGISEYAVKELSDIVFVELPEKGKRVKAGDVLGFVESVKTVSELFAPLGGEVIEANKRVAAAPESLAADPYVEGWLVKMKVDDPAEIAGLLDAAGYEKIISAAGGEE